MKNQYVADIGDYGKYALLRAFSDAGIKVGVNWYFTEDDDTNDGHFTNYLNDEKMRRYQPEIFDLLRLVANKPKKTIEDIMDNNVIPGAQFYSEQIILNGTSAERLQQRLEWFERSMVALKDADLIFMDPDNGLLEGKTNGRKDAEKYILPEEIERYFLAGHNVVYYCHKGRRKFGDWQSYKSIMFERIPTAKPTVLTYHKGTQRSYIFLIHEQDYAKYRRIIERFEDRWNRIFTEEYTEKGDVAHQTVGNELTVERSDGTTVTVSQCADGKIKIRDSRKNNSYSLLSADYFCDCISY